MKCATVTATRSRIDEVIPEILRSLDKALDGTPTWVVLSHSAEISSDEVTRAWREYAGAIPLHRLTSCKFSMGDFGLSSGHALTAFGLRDPAGAFGSAAEPLGEDISRDAGRAVFRAMEAAGRPGEAPALFFVSPVPGTEEAVLEAIHQEVGHGIPIAGGSAGDDDVGGHWSVGDGVSSHARGVVISALYPSTPVSFAFSSGYLPEGAAGTITSAEGRLVKTIDGKPAAEVYDAWTGGAVREAIRAGGGKVLMGTTLFPIGRRLGGHDDDASFLLAHPEEVLPNGGLRFFAEFKDGERIELMRGTIPNLVTRAGRVVNAALDANAAKCKGGLVVYCAGCMLTVGDRMGEVPQEISRALKAPFLGVFTFGEQGTYSGGGDRHGNLMISVVTFHE